MKLRTVVPVGRQSAAVQAFADRLAAPLGLNVEQCSVSPTLREDDLRELADAPDVVGLVLPVPEPSIGTPASEVGRIATSARRPLIFVPPVLVPAGRLQRVVLALDGEPRVSDALRPLAAQLVRGNVDVLGLHVLDPEGIPPFADQAGHFAGAFRREFAARHLEDADAAIEMRVGDPPSGVIDAARSLDADLLALAWKQRLDDGRAAIVRHALESRALPVYLVPLAPRRDVGGPPRGAE